MKDFHCFASGKRPDHQRYEVASGDRVWLFGTPLDAAEFLTKSHLKYAKIWDTHTDMEVRKA